MKKITIIKKVSLSIACVFLLTIILLLFLFYYYNKPWHRALFIKPIYKFNTNEKVIALTFDDGPSSTRTPELLDLLKKYDVKATFFVLGQRVEKYPEITKRIIEEGHLIGNHSYNHPRLYFKTPYFVKTQIERTDSLLKNLGVKDIKYFRPPYCSKMIILPLILKSMDKKLVTCSYDPMAQYKRDLNGELVAKQVIENVSPGLIIPLHDGRPDNSIEFVKAVEKIIINLKSMGYNFVAIDYVESLI